MKQTNKILNKLTAYSTVAASLLITSNKVSASICEWYQTDINPDVVLSATGLSSYNIDLDGDGQVDFRFKRSSSSVGNYIYSNFKVYGYMSYGVNNPYNRVIGVNNILYGVAYALDPTNNNFLSANASWVTKGSDTWIATFNAYVDSSMMYSYGAWPKGSNKWIDLSSNGKAEKIFGTKFEINGNIHYGWIWASLASWADGGPGLTLHAYGYNPNPNAPYYIPIPFPLCVGTEELEVDGLYAYSYGSKIYLNSNGENVTVFNSVGQRVYSGSTSKGQNIIELRGQLGYHMVNLGGKTIQLYLE